MGHLEHRGRARDAQRLVVGVDFSEEGELALECALRFAAPHEGAEVHVVHVLASSPVWIDSAPMAPFIQEDGDGVGEHNRTLAYLSTYGEIRRARLVQLSRQRSIGKLIAHVRRGRPAEQLVRMASELDAMLIVVGTHGRRGLERLFVGSVAEEVVRTAPCAVFVARHKVARERAVEPAHMPAP
jgi:nucleotide-binding universal stress UspA family protein